MAPKWPIMVISCGMDHQKLNFLLISFLSEAVEASLCSFFENFWMKHKFPHLIKPLDTIIQENYWFFYPSEPFSFDHFNVIHPVLYISDHDFGIRMSVWNNKALVTKEQWKSRTSSNLLLSLLTGRNFLTRNWFFSWIIFLLYTNLLELFFTSILVFVWQVACSFELQYWKILCIRPGTLFALAVKWKSKTTGYNMDISPISYLCFKSRKGLHWYTN